MTVTVTVTMRVTATSTTNTKARAAELALPPWAAHQQIETILFVSKSHKEPS